jgi:hypothetical protein
MSADFKDISTLTLSKQYLDFNLLIIVEKLRIQRFKLPLAYPQASLTFLGIKISPA